MTPAVTRDKHLFMRVLCSERVVSERTNARLAGCGLFVGEFPKLSTGPFERRE
jgi:hypothetical protein